MDTLYYDGKCPLCLREIGALERLRDDSLGLVDVHDHEPAPGEPTVADAERATAAARAHGADLVVAVGGGSALDGGKAIAALMTNLEPGDVLFIADLGGLASGLETWFLDGTQVIGSGRSAVARLRTPGTYTIDYLYGDAVLGLVHGQQGGGDDEAARGVATHSSGNHAAALARAASLRHVPAYIVMPTTAPTVKRAAVAGYGAEIIPCEPTLAAHESTLAQVVAQTGAAFVPPYDDWRIIAGAGTGSRPWLQSTVPKPTVGTFA